MTQNHCLRLMKLWLTTIITVFLFVACVTEDVPRNEGIAVGDPLPQFEVTLNNDISVSSETLLGKVTMIIFFSTSCSDCQRELPELEKVYKYFEGKDNVEIFAISREESPEDVEMFWTKYDLTIPYSSQTDRTIYNLFATVGVPRIYITDKNNMVVALFDDSDMPAPTEIIKLIEGILL
ncbi:MAG: TlpA family protein disulfide reductase [Muribaculaceae bacterium]|nr:TlpA family protein disulfide reductase [Muribaculaceae bacterium]